MRSLPLPGHVPGHIRDAFTEAIEDADPDALWRAAGRVWSCTDILPSSCCTLLDIPLGSTYAQAARRVRNDR
ncbi:hypothetical protein [Cellulomonas alba]|uniref:Uncharacterized protein n=1 Tax=Cellulomonas alba TaxID=3053467 RepID=A0ABT7SKA8_9CELL|nr:hypothetical protein [Cellulomonas alba]MDM7856627.1 hypothetical protein [Cellulomonas alba]